MKTIPPPCPEPETGPKYWRSLDHLAETPEFREWAEREFPAGASEMKDPVTRRDFMKIMSASFVLAGLGGAGCRRPEEHILPFSKMPEGYIHGVSQFFATAMPTTRGAIPLVARSHEGRPVKVEGNRQHPDSNGGTDLHAQASILNLYDPDRATRFAKEGNTAGRETALDALGEIGTRFQGNGGEGLSFLLEPGKSPSRRRLQAALEQKFPKARWHLHEPVDSGIQARAASSAFGQGVAPDYHFDKAQIIVSLDCDFISGEEGAHRHIRRFAKGRKIEQPSDVMNRLYVVESLLTVTGTNADHRLRIAPSEIPQVAAELARAVVNKTVSANKWVAGCAADLLKNQGKCLVVAGVRQPMAVHQLALAINNALGSFGQTITLSPEPESKEGTLSDLAKDLAANKVDTLVILGGNPSYSSPEDLDWYLAQRKAKQVFRLGYYEDETFPGTTWHYPAAHYLESWGDSHAHDGSLLAVQPLIAPLFDGVTELEVLARIAGLPQTNPYDIVRETFRGLGRAGDFEANWKQFLHDGFVPSTRTTVSPSLRAGILDEALAAVVSQKAPAPTKDRLEVVLYADYSVGDGRDNNNGWLQELPDPITKMVWDNAVLLSPKTARDLGLENNGHPKAGKYFNNVVEVEAGGKKVRGAVWVAPGMADNTIGLALGYGRDRTGRVGRGTGFNAYKLQRSASPFLITGAKLNKTLQTYMLSVTQEHGVMEGRPIIREANLEQFKAKPDFAKNMDLEAHAPNAGPIYKHPYNSDPTLKSTVHQWGMSIDLNSCVGCNACVIACQSENNIPIVGKEQVSRGREMHWLRMDRYFSSSSTEPEYGGDDPQVNHQPMLCQHCESAPCESVCPVNATVHDEEGLNVMAYNRCVGTRYCSNNCPWKVRRFNYFDYSRRPLDRLYESPLTSFTNGEYELFRWFKKPEEGSKPADEWELSKLVKNPDVSVRMRGVMEKCTFCVQRIEGAKIAQKVKVGASGDVQVPEGTFTTACAQVCPADAIVFGNLLDPDSRVSKLKKQTRDYAVLGFLDNKPRLTYLARIRNPNPDMPDYNKMPLSLKEYSDKNGSPMEAHGKADGHAEAPAAHETKGAH